MSSPSFVPDKRENDGGDPTYRIIFFCKSAGDEFPYDPRYNIYPVDNKKILTLANNSPYCFLHLSLLRWFDKWVQSKGEIYRNISKLPDVKMPVLTKEDTTISMPANYIPKPGKPQHISKARSDSLKAIRRAKLLEDAKREYQLEQDSINAAEKAKSDSIKAIMRAKMLKDIKIHNQIEQAKSDSLKAAGHDKLLEEKKRHNQQLISPGLIV